MELTETQKEVEETINCAIGAKLVQTGESIYGKGTILRTHPTGGCLIVASAN